MLDRLIAFALSQRLFILARRSGPRCRALVPNAVATSELPGMQSMARHFQEVFADVPVEYFDVDFPYRSIH